MLQVVSLQTLPALRAINCVGATKAALESKVKIDSDIFPGTEEDGDQHLSLTYQYSLNGADLGLQHASELVLSVQGSCMAEYGWTVDDPQEQETDSYRLWGSRVVRVPLDIGDVAKLIFQSHPDAEDQLRRDANVSFAAVVNTAHRVSIS